MATHTVAKRPPRPIAPQAIKPTKPVVNLGFDIYRHQPDMVAKVIALVGQGLSGYEVADATGLDYKTVSALRGLLLCDGRLSVADTRKRVVSKLWGLVEAVTEDLGTTLDQLNPRDKTILLGVSLDKLQNLGGEGNTLLVRHRVELVKPGALFSIAGLGLTGPQAPTIDVQAGAEPLQVVDAQSNEAKAPEPTSASPTGSSS